MALLVILLALVVPALSRSMRGRDLKEEAMRFVALTEYARSEAVSRGVPMAVWVQTQSRRYGAETKQGYDAAPGPVYNYTATAGVQIQVVRGKSAGAQADAASFTPDGSLDLGSAESVSFTDRSGSVLAVVKDRNNWGYEIAKAGR